MPDPTRQRLPLKAISDCRLYTFVDTAYLQGRPPADVLRALCDGGSDVVQLRAKGEPESRVLELADGLLPIAEAAGVWFAINDHPSVARRLRAPLCHLGQEDFFDAGHRHVSELAGADASLHFGLSSHRPADALRAAEAGAAYVAVGPVYPTATKPGRPAVTLEYVRWAAANLRLPWFAIGGINLANLDDVLDAGARRICVVSAILQAPDIARACHAFRNRLPSAS